MGSLVPNIQHVTFYMAYGLSVTTWLPISRLDASDPGLHAYFIFQVPDHGVHKFVWDEEPDRGLHEADLRQPGEPFSPRRDSNLLLVLAPSRRSLLLGLPISFEASDLFFKNCFAQVLKFWFIWEFHNTKKSTVALTTFLIFLSQDFSDMIEISFFFPGRPQTESPRFWLPGVDLRRGCRHRRLCPPCKPHCPLLLLLLLLSAIWNSITLAYGILWWVEYGSYTMLFQK